MKTITLDGQEYEFVDIADSPEDWSINKEMKAAGPKIAKKLDDLASPEESIDSILDHTVYKQGNGPNGSGGEWEYWKGDVTVPLKAKLQDLIIRERLDELKLLAGATAERTERETWKDWSWRVTNYMQDRINELKGSGGDNG